MAARRPPLEIAQQHEKKGNLAKAAEAYSEYLSGKPSDVRVLLRLGEIRERLGEAALAAEAFHKLGILHAKDGMESKATAMLRRALKLMPAHLASVQLMADVLARAGKTRDALDTLAAGSQTAAASGDLRTRLKMLERAANLDPGLSSKLIYAQALVESGKQAEAFSVLRLAADRLDQQDAPMERLQVLERLLYVSSGDSKIALEAANAAIALRDYRRALISLRIALEKNPDHVDLISLTATVLNTMGEDARALLIFREAARMYGRAGRTGDAKKNWGAVLRLSPADAEAHAAMGTKWVPQARQSPPRLGPLAGIELSELNDALSALDERSPTNAPPVITGNELEITLDELDVDLVIEIDDTHSGS
jgi:tetratricopeptide (TPR) repeat protein